MYTDVIDLRAFYAGPLGQTTRRLIRRRLRGIWPNLRGRTVAGMGYATPFLSQFRDEAGRLIAIMPAAQGAIHWPSAGPHRVVLADDAELPLPDASIDYMILVHGLECSEQVRPMMREIWRVMSASGRLLVVAPNRRGIWARVDRTPFGHGHPYSRGQLERLLRDSMFMPLRHATALHLPPLRSQTLLRAAAAFDDVGGRWFPTFAGVVMWEAQKQVFARSGGVPVQSTRPVLVPEARGAAVARLSARPERPRLDHGGVRPSAG